MSKSLNGIFVKHNKNTENSATEVMPIPDKVSIPMSQHMGKPCDVVVKLTDEVKVGQLIGAQSGFISAPIHSSVSGKVTGIDDVVLSNGMQCKTVIITTDKLQEVAPTVVPPTVTNFDEFIAAVKESGLVGLGGAGFPTYVKFSPKNLSEVDTLIINGAECEPYITSDYRCIMEESDNIIKGVAQIKKWLGIKNIYMAIEDNKPEGIKKMQELSSKIEGFKIVSLKSKYPQGGEKVLIYEVTGRIVAEGKLPADVGVIVSNVTSVAFLAKYLETGMPLVEKRITVDGSAITSPKNIIAPIGTSIEDIVNFCGGFKEEPKKILMGGPMMGLTVRSLDTTLIKNNNAILAFNAKDSVQKPETACIRCGRCVSACPFNLMPAAIAKNYKLGNVDALINLKVNLCMECGCCSYVCPAKKDLVLTNKLAKKLIQTKK
ncbi:MAG: electron transport complex subunit RsxC [Oscillospiraceae bacterium]